MRMRAIAVIGFFILGVSGFAHAAPTSTGPSVDGSVSADVANCATIDANWKEHGRQILGANEKVSDVVLNACEAIGGGCNFASGCRYKVDNNGNPINAEAQAMKARGCTPNGGASRSQHLHSRAIDLTVPDGKQAESMTLAICGLRRVNNCEGGLGLYSGGSIHVDVRPGTAIWSDSYGSDSVANLRDEESKSVLYGFENNECAGGTVVGDYSEEDMYGPVVQYTPPRDISALYSPQARANQYQSFTNPRAQFAQRQFVPTTGSTAIGRGVFYQDGRDAESRSSFLNRTDGQLDTGSQDQSDNTQCSFIGSLFGTCARDDNDFTPRDRDESPHTSATGTTNANESRKQVSDRGILHTTTTPVEMLFHRTRGTFTSRAEVDTSKDERGSTIKEEDTKNESVLSQLIPGSDFVVTARNSARQRARMQGDAKSSPRDLYEREPSFTVFMRGEQRDVARGPSPLVRQSLRFAEQSTQVGAYYGFVHGVSPLVVASAPRTLVRIVNAAFGSRVYNTISQ